jgi:hypothetical protein
LKKEWELLEELEPLLEVSWCFYFPISCSLLFQVFLVATEEVSHSSIPLIHKVIRIYNIITSALDDLMDETSCPLAIHAAALRGFTMLNKYYSLTDEPVVYHIAISA